MAPLIHVTDSFWLPSWIFVISLSLSLSLFWVIARARQFKVRQTDALDLSLTLMVGGFIGGRLLHVLYEQPGFYFQSPLSILKFWQGGFVFYGGMAGSLIAAYLFCRRRLLNFWQWADFFTPIVAANYAAGRVGCFLNGCCYGRACAFPWGMEFPSHRLLGIDLIPRHPTQLFAVGIELIFVGGLLLLEKRKLKPGSVFLIWLCLHGVGRIFLEHFRDDDRGPLVFHLVSISTFISIILVATAAFILKVRLKNSPTKS